MLSSSSSEAGGVRSLFICSLIWRPRPRTEREGFVGVVGLSLSVFTELLSFAVGFLELCNKQLESVAKYSTYRGGLTLFFLRVAGEFKFPDPGVCILL